MMLIPPAKAKNRGWNSDTALSDVEIASLCMSILLSRITAAGCGKLTGQGRVEISDFWL